MVSVCFQVSSRYMQPHSGSYDLLLYVREISSRHVWSQALLFYTYQALSIVSLISRFDTVLGSHRAVSFPQSGQRLYYWSCMYIVCLYIQGRCLSYSDTSPGKHFSFENLQWMYTLLRQKKRRFSPVANCKSWNQQLMWLLIQQLHVVSSACVFWRNIGAETNHLVWIVVIGLDMENILKIFLVMMQIMSLMKVSRGYKTQVLLNLNEGALDSVFNILQGDLGNIGDFVISANHTLTRTTQPVDSADCLLPQGNFVLHTKGSQNIIN